MSAIEITYQNLSISGLRAAAARTADAKQARRLLAIAMVLDGHSRRLAAQAGGMDRQTLRDWVIPTARELDSWGFPKRRKRDSMRHVVDSRSGQHVGNRDYIPKSEYFGVAGGGGADG